MFVARDKKTNIVAESNPIRVVAQKAASILLGGLSRAVRGDHRHTLHSGLFRLRQGLRLA